MKRIRWGAIVVIALAMAMPAAAWGKPPSRSNPLVGATPCAVEHFPAPVRTELPGYDFASCLPVDAEHRLCKARYGDDPEVLLFLAGTTERWRWPADGYLGDTSDFALYRVPVSNGGPSWVIANHWSSSNGLGVESSDLLFVPASVTGLRPLAFTVEDFGPSAFVRLAGTDQCLVLATEWFPDEDPKRGPGMYYGAGLFQSVGAELLPVAERPAVARRLLDSFDSERGKDMWDGPERPWAIGDPLKWLASAHAEVRASPLAKRPVARRESGTITAVTYDDATLAPLVTVALAAGGEVKLRERNLPPERCGPDPGTHELPIGRLGDSASHALFPRSYRPADVAALVGRPATLITYRDHDPGATTCPPRILWLDPPNGSP